MILFFSFSSCSSFTDRTVVVDTLIAYSSTVFIHINIIAQFCLKHMRHLTLVEYNFFFFSLINLTTKILYISVYENIYLKYEYFLTVLYLTKII